MKKLITKKLVFNPLMLLLLTFSMLMAGNVNAQKYDLNTSSDLELLEQKNMDYMKQIDKIIKDYPGFEYNYTFEDGKLKNVTVTGVDNVIDRKRLEVILFDLKSNENALKGKTNSMGVFYTVDNEPRYKGGEDALENTLQSNLKYPEDAQNWGVEGTIYVKFVVDENGNVPFATTSEVLNSKKERYVKELEKQAVKAVKATSGNWVPGKVDGVKVASLAVVPIKFDNQLTPGLADWIQ